MEKLEQLIPMFPRKLQLPVTLMEKLMTLKERFPHQILLQFFLTRREGALKTSVKFFHPPQFPHPAAPRQIRSIGPSHNCQTHPQS